MSKTKNNKVAVIMGSKSDWPVMKDAVKALKELKVLYEIMIVSAHRTPKWMYDYATQAENKNISIIIAGAGGAAHLPGMVASLTSLPVIGVPISVGQLKGLDALLSIAQMPKGVPVASVAVNNSYNAGLLACRILALNDAKLNSRLKNYTNKKRKFVLKNKKLS